MGPKKPRKRKFGDDKKPRKKCRLHDLHMHRRCDELPTCPDDYVRRPRDGSQKKYYTGGAPPRSHKA